MQQQAPVRVLIAGRNPAWTAGMVAFVSGAGLEADAAATVDGALAALDAGGHHVLVVGRALRDAPGAELAREAARRQAGVTVVVALADGSPEAQLEALAAGAAGCIPPDAGRDAVVEAIHDAMRGVPRFDLEALRPLADLMRRTAPREVLLTEQERVVLRLMRQHLTYKEIAQRLGVSWHTVRTHAQSILRKSGVHSRRDLDAWDQRLDSGAAREVPR
ncbi:MAG TPA: response regulator transcription factor [Miltoncostaea sp.]|nr:response regulator transcription factor [Miltoncostaea sp.]